MKAETHDKGGCQQSAKGWEISGCCRAGTQENDGESRKTMLPDKEDYIQKGIGWLLKVCSQYDQEVIIKYLEKNKKDLSRLILRYASEKLPKVIRARILQK